jgi:SAM-dependent methyltransferase
MNEASKSRKAWGELEKSVLRGKGIDIGCGPDPVADDARRFDVEDGDANQITQYISDQFDYVFASHCLEHMHQPREAILEWWKLVKPGGHLFIIVPDEDLYEMGVFPSRFNPDHKATFTIAKAKSWSPVSINVLDLARTLPGGELVSLVLQDADYDRSRLIFGEPRLPGWENFMARAYRRSRRKGWLPFRLAPMEYLLTWLPTDQTHGTALAQIQCIVRKRV